MYRNLSSCASWTGKDKTKALFVQLAQLDRSQLDRSMQDKRREEEMLTQIVTTGEVYHVCTKSIAEFKIFNTDRDFLRMKEEFKYYQTEKHHVAFCKFQERNMQYLAENIDIVKRLVQIICYCIMPTHIHLVLKQLKDGGLSIFMKAILNSYSHYFNLKHNRKGPLWEGRFKRVLVETDEQLLHLTRYIHLNPVTAYLVSKPEEWAYSSYKEYIEDKTNSEKICNYKDVLDIKADSYKVFTEDRISYQRELAKIKNLMLDRG